MIIIAILDVTEKIFFYPHHKVTMIEWMNTYWWKMGG